MKNARIKMADGSTMQAVIANPDGTFCAVVVYGKTVFKTTFQTKRGAERWVAANTR